jgi:hypothetical protein
MSATNPQLPVPSSRQNSRNTRMVWCECRLPLWRGSRHRITKKQRRRHEQACLIQHIPFTDLDAALVDEAASHNRTNDIHSNTSSNPNVEPGTHNPQDLDMHQDQEEDDVRIPNVTDWLEDITAVDTDINRGFETAADDLEFKALEMFDAFVGTPRARVKKMREAITKHYGVDIGDPIRKGRQAVDDLLGDVITPITIPCCSDGCVAYTGRLLAASQCPSCGKQRFNQDGNVVYSFQYIPLLPRLRLQYSDAKRSKQLTSYRASFNPAQTDNGHRNDVFDGDWFRECWLAGYFQDNRHLALRLTLDAIGTVKHPKKRQTVTPVVLHLLNLHPSIREDASNALTAYLIPGGFNKDFADTWLDPLVTELLELHSGVNVHDGESQRDFMLKAHVILVTGDGPAIADVMGTKSPGKSKQSCRMCPFTGTQGRAGRYYYPNNGELQPALHRDMRDQIERLEHHRTTATSQQHYANILRDLGVTCRSILMDLPTVHFPRSFPIDTMHSMNHNIPKSMFKLWKGAKYQQRGQGVPRHPWVISESDWELVDQSLLASRATVPARVGTAPRGTSSFGNWTTHEWRSHFMTYGAPALHRYLQEPYALNFLRYRQLLHYTSVRNFTSTDILKVESLAASFVDEYENLYYYGDFELLPSCTIQYHYLLHLGQNIRDFGPPSCFAQWTLERFLRTIRRFSTATAYKHRSAEINMLNREQRLHAQWHFKGQYTVTSDDHLLYADDSLSLSHQLVDRTSKTMDPRWQRELQKVDDPLASWHTGTHTSELVLYRGLILPSGAKVGTFSPTHQRLVSRNNSLVMYYADPPATAQRETVQLSFGTVVVLFEEPTNSSQWAGIARYRKVKSPSHHPPRPRMFDEHDTDFFCIPIHQIVDLVGAAQVYYRRGALIEKHLFLVDKHSRSEEDVPQHVSRIGSGLAAIY